MKLATGVAQPMRMDYGSAGRKGRFGPKDVDFVSLGFANTIAAMSESRGRRRLRERTVRDTLVDQPAAPASSRWTRSDHAFPRLFALWHIADQNESRGRAALHGRVLARLRDYKLAFGPEKQNTADIIATLKKYNMIITPTTPSMGIPDDAAPSFVGVAESPSGCAVSVRSKRCPTSNHSSMTPTGNMRSAK